MRDKPRGRGTPPLLLRAFLVPPAGARAPSRRQGVQGARCRPEWMGQGRSGVSWGSWKLASDTGKDTGVQGEERKRAGRGTIGLRGTPGPGLCCSTQVWIKHVTCLPQQAAQQPCVNPSGAVRGPRGSRNPGVRTGVPSRSRCHFCTVGAGDSRPSLFSHNHEASASVPGTDGCFLQTVSC